MKVSTKKPTKKEIQSVLETGVVMVEKTDFISDIIRRDLHHRDENNQTQLTQSFDKIIGSVKIEKQVKDDLKRFIKKQVQTLVKEKAVQLAVLGDDKKLYSVTVKKVTKPMIENNDNLYSDKFKASDEGSYRVVKMNKAQKEELSLEEKTLKFMKSNGLFQGEKGDEKEPKCYDLECMKQIIDNLEKGIV